MVLILLTMVSSNLIFFMPYLSKSHQEINERILLCVDGIYNDISSITTLCPYPGIAIIIMSLLSIRSLDDLAILQSNLKSKTPLTIIPRSKPLSLYRRRPDSRSKTIF